MVEFSIIIPTFNREHLLLKCLESLLNQVVNKSQVEVLVSSDARLSDHFEEKYSWVNFLEGPKKGPAANRNFAAKKCKGNWLIFIDDDCIPSQEWVDAIIEYISKNKPICLEGCTLSIGEKSCFDEVAPINLNGGKLWSCNFAIRKSVFFEMNGFDEQFKIATMEDMDFKLRLEKYYPISFVPDMIVYHPWRRKIAFKNFARRIVSQKRFYSLHPELKGYRFRLSRVKIFVYSIPKHLKQLVQYKGRGVLFFIDKTLFNLILIFI